MSLYWKTMRLRCVLSSHGCRRGHLSLIRSTSHIFVTDVCATFTRIPTVGRNFIYISTSHPLGRRDAGRVRKRHSIERERCLLLIAKANILAHSPLRLCHAFLLVLNTRQIFHFRCVKAKQGCGLH
jgi:hypothetical protein